MSDTSDFGDWEEADAFGTEPADPEQVARKLHDLRMAVDEMRGRIGEPRWIELSDDDRQVGIDLITIVLAWMRRQGAS